MSEVTVVQQELELVNIVEIVQDKLTRNFTLLLKRLNHHDTLFAQHQLQTSRAHDQHLLSFRRIEEAMALQQQQVTERMDQIFKRIALVQSRHEQLQIDVTERGVGVKRLSDELFNTQLQFEEKIKQHQLQMSQIIRNIEILSNEQGRMMDEINKKENKIQNERLAKDTEILKDKNDHLESELKLAHHKIQKIEILNEKAERLQAKKEMEILKEIEERVKKEIKFTINEIGTATSPVNPNPNNQNSIVKGTAGQTNAKVMSNGNRPTILYGNGSPALGRISMNANQMGQIKQRQNQNSQSGYNNNGMGSSQIGSDLMGSNMDVILQKWGDKIKYLQVQLKEVIQNLKILNKNSSNKKAEMKENSSSEGIKDKLNEIKPEIIKLWAKMDTIDDRLSFSERKLEEKMKGFNELATMIKDNNPTRIEEKLKNIQTEIFTNLKQIRAKLDTKVNLTDFDKYCQSMSDQVVQINEMIYLKSDKLEVKKALLFLESKIKEIILVISEDEENQKDALLTKKQLKCISCDKELEKFSGVVSSPKGNWDSLPYKDHPSEILGRFGMTNFGSLAKKIKKLESKDLPILNKRNVNQSFQNSS